MLAYLGAYVESMLAICETISVERPPRCQFFLPGPLRGTKNHVKTKVFDFRQPKKGIGRGYETPEKKRCFCDFTHAKHRKLQGLPLTRGPPGVNRGGSAAGGAAPIKGAGSIGAGSRPGNCSPAISRRARPRSVKHAEFNGPGPAFHILSSHQLLHLGTKPKTARCRVFHGERYLEKETKSQKLHRKSHEQVAFRHFHLVTRLQVGQS